MLRWYREAVVFGVVASSFTVATVLGAPVFPMPAHGTVPQPTVHRAAATNSSVAPTVPTSTVDAPGIPGPPGPPGPAGVPPTTTGTPLTTVPATTATTTTTTVPARCRVPPSTANPASRPICLPARRHS